jgi:hypothetical protein
VKQSSAAGNSRLTAVLEQFANSLLLLLLLPGPMPLDSDPIYCAEQIVIPPDLGDILKAYAKEVIRNEPEDIFEFSAKYFAQFVTSGGYKVHARVSASVSVAAVKEAPSHKFIHLFKLAHLFHQFSLTARSLACPPPCSAIYDTVSRMDVAA